MGVRRSGPARAPVRSIMSEYASTTPSSARARCAGWAQTSIRVTTRQWRFEVDSALGAARELLGMAEAPDLAGLVGRADAVLADDDRVFARRATEDHAEAWEARWQKLERRADEAGLSVHDHGVSDQGHRRGAAAPEGPGLAGKLTGTGSRASSRPSMPAAKPAGRPKHGSPCGMSARPPMQPPPRPRSTMPVRLVSDPALPSTLRSRLTLAIERHERLTQGRIPDSRCGGPCHRRRHADCAGGA